MIASHTAGWGLPLHEGFKNILAVSRDRPLRILCYLYRYILDLMSSKFNFFDVEFARRAWSSLVLIVYEWLAATKCRFCRESCSDLHVTVLLRTSFPWRWHAGLSWGWFLVENIEHSCSQISIRCGSSIDWRRLKLRLRINCVWRWGTWDRGVRGRDSLIVAAFQNELKVAWVLGRRHFSLYFTCFAGKWWHV